MTNLIGQSLGRYHILEQLGEGGMATVYKAYDTRLERDVAVKVIRRGLFGDEVLQRMLKRFEREAKALARLSHPNIVKVHDYGEYEGSPYLVMEFLPGGTLKQKLGKPMAWEDAIRILLPIARALQYAHAEGMIHRDVKPSNILITRSGDPMLSDFGIAKILESDEMQTLTGTGMGVGTPEYMAPEQWTGGAGTQADLYSLGVVLYEMVTGRKPYTADTPAAILLKQASEPLPRPSQYVRDLPDAVEKLLLKALARKPEDRYPEMIAFVNALGGLVGGETAVGKPVIHKEKSPKRAPEETTHDVLDVQKPSIPPPTSDRKGISWKRWLLVVGLVVVLGISLALGSGLLNLGLKGQVSLAGLATYTPTAMKTSTPTRTLTPTNTPLPTLTFTPTLGIGSTWTRPADVMVMSYVPEGNFTMGMIAAQADQICDQSYNNQCLQNWFKDEEPVHTVYLDAYWIDQTEVTNRMYALCVAADVCQPPDSYTSHTRNNYYGNPEFGNYPVLYVSWFDAQTYCEWAGARLPTEAEWEKAARGVDAYVYPWGNTEPSCFLVNFYPYMAEACKNDTTAVGSYPAGASPYGVLDMAGNVQEWVADWYDENYFSYAPANNPQGPSFGMYHLLRGGAWYDNGNYIRSAQRNWQTPPLSAYKSIGFRCALSSNTVRVSVPSIPQDGTSVQTPKPHAIEISTPVRTPVPTQGLTLVPTEVSTSIPTRTSNTAPTKTSTSIPTNCHSFTTVVDPPGYGTINVLTLPNCGSGYLHGTGVTVQAVPSSGKSFVSWIVDYTPVTGLDTLLVSVYSDKVVTAKFSDACYTLSISSVGPGSAYTNSSPNCGETRWLPGSSVTVITATDHTFDHWEGACTGSGTCVVVMDDNKSVIAHFIQ